MTGKTYFIKRESACKGSQIESLNVTRPDDMDDPDDIDYIEVNRDWCKAKGRDQSRYGLAVAALARADEYWD